VVDFVGSCLEIQNEIGVYAEYDNAKTILVNTPHKTELFMGILHPDAALFSCPFDPLEAIKEHQSFIGLLEDNGAKVINVRDVLLADVHNQDGIALNKLKEAAKFSLKYFRNDIEDLSGDDYKNSVISTLNPELLVDVILTRPEIHLKSTDANTFVSASYKINPLMNLYFLRDQSITTCKGIVLSKMNSDQRADEVSVIKFVYDKIGITPLYQIEANGRLEGGDFITTGDVDFIGQGLRTNAEAITQLLENKVLCGKKLVVVKDNWYNQEQMHLDTYFNIMAPKKAVLVESRIGVSNNNIMSLRADIYEQNDQGYELISSDHNFESYLRNNLSYSIIPVPVDDQLKYGVNFLTIKTNNIIAIDGVSDKYKKALQDAGVNATWINFSNLTCGYGAAHCTTQVIYRV